MSAAGSRLAVYWAPEPESALRQAGCRWLGRSPDGAGDGSPLPFRAAAWRYGFHATLKPPMSLREGVGIDELVASVARLASETPAFPLPRLAVVAHDGFIALRPQPELEPAHPLQGLAARCVQELDRYRATQPARRPTAGLDARQMELLARWGYPHVLDRWRFHLTLSDALELSSPPAQQLQAEAREHFAAALEQPHWVASICVFEEPAPGAALQIAARLPLQAAACDDGDAAQRPAGSVDATNGGVRAQPPL